MKTHVRTHEKRERKFQPLPVIEGKKYEILIYFFKIYFIVVKVKSNSEITPNVLNPNFENLSQEKKSENLEQQKLPQLSEGSLGKVQLIKSLIQFKMIQSQAQSQSQIPVMMPANTCYLQMAPVPQYHHMTPMTQYPQMHGYPLMHQMGNSYTVIAASQIPQMPQMQSFGYYKNPNYSNNINNFLPTPSNFGPQVPVTYQAVSYPQYGINPNLSHSSY